MLEHPSGSRPAPDRTTSHPARSHSSQYALLRWLSEPRLGSSPKPRSIGRLSLFSALAVTVIVSATLVGCGSEEPASEPARERPATRTTDRSDSGSLGSTASNVVPDATTPANDQQPAQAPSAGSGGSGAPRQASRAEPAGTPTTPAASGQSGQTERPAPTGEQIKQAEDLYVEAELYLWNQRFHRAAHTLDRAIAINPNLAEAYTLRGFARTMASDHDGAMRDFDTALEMQAQNAGRAYAFRSYAHSEMGNYEDALADAERAREMANYEDRFARADADLAHFTALYRSGDYGSIDTYSLQQLPQGSAHEINQNLAPYGLFKLYEHVDLRGNIDPILEADTHLLLNPDDTGSLHNRHNAHRNLRWHAQALRDLSKIIELTGEERRANLYVLRARTWTQIGDYEAAVENAGDLDPSRDVEAATLLAIAYWNLGDVQKATDAVDAFDYSDPTALFHWDEDRPPTGADALYPDNSYEVTAHLALKGRS